MMQAAELGIPTHQNELDLPGADDIRINDVAPVTRAAGNIIELVPMNFSFPPSGRGRTSLQLQIRREAFPQK